jgi:hypothetical protein
VLRRRQFRVGDKGGTAVGKTKRGKGTKWMVVVDGRGTPLGAHLDAASPHEVTLLERTLATIAVPRAHTPGRPRPRPDRLIGDKAYDSNALRARLAHRGIVPIFPAQPNHPHATHQDRRLLRRYKRRWIVERTNTVRKYLRQAAPVRRATLARARPVFAQVGARRAALVALLRGPRRSACLLDRGEARSHFKTRRKVRIAQAR